MFNVMESQISKDLKFIYKSPEGNRLLKELWTRYVEGVVASDKPEATYYNLGKRDLILELFTEMKIKPEPMENE